MIVVTASGAKYEFDRHNSARRLPGDHDTGRTPAGVWRKYAALYGPHLGQSMLFWWADESVGKPAAPGTVPGTVTTPVVSIQ